MDKSSNFVSKNNEYTVLYSIVEEDYNYFRLTLSVLNFLAKAEQYNTNDLTCNPDVFKLEVSSVKVSHCLT